MSPVCVCQHGADDHNPACIILGCDCQMFRVEESLDAAWQEAEAALPGWTVVQVSRWLDETHDYSAGPTDEWRATAYLPERVLQSRLVDKIAEAEGDTPAAALRALAVKLREGRE